MRRTELSYKNFLLKYHFYILGSFDNFIIKQQEHDL